MLPDLTAAVVLVLALAGAAVGYDSHQTDPADCVMYPVSKGLHRSSVTKTFQRRVLVSLSAPYSSSQWAMRLVVRSSRHNCHYDLVARDVGELKIISEVRGECSSWPEGSTAMVANTTFLGLHGWSAVDIILTEGNDLMLVSTDLGDVESMTLPFSGLEGELQLEVTGEDLVHVVFDCYLDCFMRSGTEYHSTLGNEFYFWRGTHHDSLLYTAFPHTHRNRFSVVENEPILHGLHNWITVVIDEPNRLFSWANLGSTNWRSLPWSAGNLQAMDDIINNLVIEVPSSSLVTNCHPYQLPCAHDPLHCQVAHSGHASSSSLFDTWRSAMQWVVLGTLLVIILVLVFLVCHLRRTLNRYSINNRSNSRTEKILLSDVPKCKRGQFVAQSELFEDFSSDNMYESPNEFRGVSNVYTNDKNRSSGLGNSTQSQLYYNTTRKYSNSTARI